MSRVKQRDTAPERSLRTLLHQNGLRYRINKRVANVLIDIAFPRVKLAVLIDGCFWHCCPLHATYPKTNIEYWLPKLRANQERDARQAKRLVEAGWSVIRVWEHDCNPPSTALVEQIRVLAKAEGKHEYS